MEDWDFERGGQSGSEGKGWGANWHHRQHQMAMREGEVDLWVGALGHEDLGKLTPSMKADFVTVGLCEPSVRRIWIAPSAGSIMPQTGCEGYMPT